MTSYSPLTQADTDKLMLDEALLMAQRPKKRSVSLLYVFGSAMIHMVVLVWMMSAPEEVSSLEMDDHSLDERFVQFITTPTPPKQAEMVIQDKEHCLGARSKLDAQAMAPEALEHPCMKKRVEQRSKYSEGRAGTQHTPVVDQRMAIKRTEKKPSEPIRRERMEDEGIALHSGALAVLHDAKQSSLGNVQEAIGSDTIDALGNLSGTKQGQSKGFGGLGITGAGRGGPGEDLPINLKGTDGMGMSGGGVCGCGPGSFGEGGLTRGIGQRITGGLALDKTDDTAPPESSESSESAMLGKKKTVQVVVTASAEPETTGHLAKPLIQRVVRQHNKEIRYCYEQALKKDPSLEGAVTMRFTISNTGRVLMAMTKSSTLKHRGVERCMARKIQRWAFPKPEGNGLVQVSYPFQLSAR